MLELCTDKTEVLRHIAEGEGQCMDLKLRVDSSRKIASSLVAFANSDGGRLFIGVKDNGKIRGIDPEEEFYMIQAASEMYTSPPVPFTQSLHKFPEGQVLEILVQASDLRPHYYLGEERKQVFIRQEDEIYEASGVHVRSWKESNRPSMLKYSEKEQIILRFLDEEGEMSFGEGLQLVKSAPLALEMFLAKMLSWNIIGIAYDQNGAFYYPQKEHEQVY